MNPTYYGLESVEEDAVNAFLSRMVEDTLWAVQDSGCLLLNEEDGNVEPTTYGRIASYYYLSHLTMRHFAGEVVAGMSVPDVLRVLCDAHEFAELPVRHNEDVLNAELAKLLPLPVKHSTLDNPHTKCFLLLQAHLTRAPLPIADYRTDTKSVMDQCVRVLQAMIDVAADAGLLDTTLQMVHVGQMLRQGLWFDDSTLACVPHFVDHPDDPIGRLAAATPPIRCLPELMAAAAAGGGRLQTLLGGIFSRKQQQEMQEMLQRLPAVDVSLSVMDAQGTAVGPGTTLAADAEYALKLTLSTRCVGAC